MFTEKQTTLKHDITRRYQQIMYNETLAAVSRIYRAHQAWTQNEQWPPDC